MNARALQIGNWFVFIGVIAINYLATALPIAGRTTGEISDMYPNLFTPAGFTFSIWGIIYLGLLWFAIRQSKGLFSNATPPDYVLSIGPWFIINGLANMAWILAWHNLLVWGSLLIMAVILLSLVVIYRRLDGYSWKTFRGIKAPFSIYLGWIIVATIANTTVGLSSSGYTGTPLNPAIWTAILVALASGVGFFMIIRFGDIFFASVIIWALVGIISKLLVSFDWPFLPVVVASIGVVALIVMALIRMVLLLRRPASVSSQ